MDTTQHQGQLAGLAALCASSQEIDTLVEGALPVLAALSGADRLAVVQQDGSTLRVSTQLGDELDHGSLTWEALPREQRLTSVAIPLKWHEAGIQHVAAQRLPGHHGVVILAWSEWAPDNGSTSLEIALTMLDTAVAKLDNAQRLADLTHRVNNAQILANMGDYDWHIPTDTNTWSDQLYRIYGHEPKAFNASYERFLSLIHPDDREKITGIHQEAYATGKPYAMIERIVRPDGETRYLSSNGEVIMDATGSPERMRGTCIDITERVLAERERAHIAARFRGLVESAPDAILVLDDAGRVLEANPRAHELLAGDPVGHDINEMLPVDALRDGLSVTCDDLDDGRLLLDITTAAVDQIDDEKLVAVFLRDAHVRLAGEELAARAGEEQLRRRQALEINDNVVQGLVAASYALEQDATESAMSFLERTLTAARGMMDDLLEPLDGSAVQPGGLTRASAATIGLAPVPEVPEQEAAPPPPVDLASRRRDGEVLVVDDAEDLRMLLRLKIERSGHLKVVGEAGDGLSAIELAAKLQPDLILLDLAMPTMDGLEALPRIREVAPNARVVVLSGFNEGSMAQKALEAGAVKYVEKGGSMAALMDMLETMVATA